MMRVAAPNFRWFFGDDGRPRVGVDRATRTVRAEWDGVSVSVHDDVVEVEADTTVDAEWLDKLRNGAGEALRRYLAGACVFHAAAVEREGRALVIVGEGGAGKSTSAAALCAQGAALLSDDITVIRSDKSMIVEPIERNHWLDSTSRDMLAIAGDVEQKTPTTASRIATGRATLWAIVDLQPAAVTEVHMTTIRGADAMTTIIKAALRLPLGREQDIHDFEAFSTLAQYARIYRVLRPRRFSATLLNELVNTLNRLLDPS